jgi:hypothetical protein
MSSEDDRDSQGRYRKSMDLGAENVCLPPENGLLV